MKSYLQSVIYKNNIDVGLKEIRFKVTFLPFINLSLIYTLTFEMAFKMPQKLIYKSKQIQRVISQNKDENIHM